MTLPAVIACLACLGCFACEHGAQREPREPVNHPPKEPLSAPSAAASSATGAPSSSEGANDAAGVSATGGTSDAQATTSSAASPSTSAAASPTPNSSVPVSGVRLLVVAASGELLASERRQVDGIATRVRRAGQTVSVDEASSEEAAFVQSLSQGDESSPRPASWNAFRTVAVLYVGPSTELTKGRRLTGGVAGVWVFQTGSAAAVLSLQSESDARPQVDAKDHGELIASFVERVAQRRNP